MRITLVVHPFLFGTFFVLALYAYNIEELSPSELLIPVLGEKVLIEALRKEYNHLRPHSSLGYQPPAPEAIMPSYQAVGLTLEVVQ